MKTLWVVALIAVAALAADGCKSSKPEPIPGPKAAVAVIKHIRPNGIAWFQGSVEEPFARAYMHRAEGQGRATADRWEQPCPTTIAPEASARGGLRPTSLTQRTPTA